MYQPNTHTNNFNSIRGFVIIRFSSVVTAIGHYIQHDAYSRDGDDNGQCEN